MDNQKNIKIWNKGFKEKHSVTRRMFDMDILPGKSLQL